MKISGWFLRIGLIVMIAVSVVLSWNIWQNPSQVDHQITNAVVPTKSPQSDNAMKSTVFLPNEAYFQTNKDRVRLYSTSGNVVKDLRDAMKSWRIKKINTAKQLSRADYESLLTQKGSLQLVYFGLMSYEQFEPVFFKNKSVEKTIDFKFNRLIVDTRAKEAKLTFVNDETMTIYDVTMVNAGVSDVNKQITAYRATGLPVRERRHRTREITYYIQPLELVSTTFLIDSQNANRFISLLMPAAKASQVETREIGDETVYTVNNEYRLTQEVNGEMTFVDQSGQLSTNAGLTTRLDKGFSSLNTLNLQGISDMQYFAYDPAQQMITFSAQAHGLPVFSDAGMGRVSVQNGTDSTTVNFSLKNLTVMIPTTQEIVKLPPTRTIVNQLYQRGFTDDQIGDILIAYDWQNDASASEVVTLKPTYYVAIDGEYKPYTEWLKTINVR